MISAVLDKQITFKRKVMSKSNFGAVSYSYETVKIKAAQVTQTNVTNQFSDGVQVIHQTDFIIRYDEDINYDLIIEYKNNTYSIKAIKEFGRREMLTITAERIINND